jgi:hypothetical protein
MLTHGMANYNGLAVGIVPAAVVKITPVRYDFTEGSEQEEDSAHICARLWQQITMPETPSRIG